MPFRKPCHMPFRKLIPPFTLTGVKTSLKKANAVSTRSTWGLKIQPRDSEQNVKKQ